MKPPYTLNTQIIDFISKISLLVGKQESYLNLSPDLNLRKENRIKTIQGSVAIEGNSLSLEQVSAIIDDQRVLGPKKDIIEVKNAIKAYDQLKNFDYQSQKSFLKAHKILMTGLEADAGHYRTKNVGILKGTAISHVAPQAKMLGKLMDNLFKYLKSDDHLLVKSCVFHYEQEFIHPFSDGNGRMGRLWQSLILSQFNSVFEFIPIESLIKDNQQEYYQALEKSDKAGESTIFLEFMLSIIHQALKDFSDTHRPGNIDQERRIEIARQEFTKQSFTRKDYMNLFKNISAATASRDLKYATDSSIISKKGDKRTTVYKFS